MGCARSAEASTPTQGGIRLTAWATPRAAGSSFRRTALSLLKTRGPLGTRLNEGVVG